MLITVKDPLAKGFNFYNLFKVCHIAGHPVNNMPSYTKSQTVHSINISSCTHSLFPQEYNGI